MDINFSMISIAGIYSIHNYINIESNLSAILRIRINEYCKKTKWTLIQELAVRRALLLGHHAIVVIFTVLLVLTVYFYKPEVNAHHH